ncbi:MAG: LysR family transcriptional regulator [Lautropia sp.]|nr:LysR family transcriptional regulator [Lautropia sp.]
MDMLTSLKVFRHVAESGSFTAAATRLGLSPAMASKHIARLEQELGARLLNRSSRHVSLTEAGAVYFDHCREALDTLDGAAAALREGHDEPRGSLRLTAPVWCATGYFARLLAGYRSRYPQVILDLHLSNRKADLAREAFDLALRVTNDPAANLIVRRICDIRFHAVATPELLRAYRQRSKPAAGTASAAPDLSKLNAIIASYLPPSSTLAVSGPAGQVGARVSTIMRSDNTSLTYECVLAGVGAALLPEWLVQEDLATGRLEPVMPQFAPITVTLHAAYTSRMFLTPKVRTFIDYLAAAMKPGEGQSRAP